MGVTVNVPGLATIKVASGLTPETLSVLGYTQNGAMVTIEGYEVKVPGDENGGDDGPPVEIQYLGQTARVRLELTKFDVAVADIIAKRLPSGTLGTPITSGTAVGSLVFANGQFFRLTIDSPIRPMNFPCAVLVRPPQEINIGTKFQRLVVEAECYKHPTTGILWDRTVA